MTGTVLRPTERNSGSPAAHALLDVLVGWGIRRVFCCPGSTEAAFLDAVVERSGEVELVLTTHESVAVAMADGAARVTGQPQVAYLHTNVGLANGVAHLTAAQLGNAPVLVLNGLKSTALQGRDGFTTVPYPRDLVRQHVKWARQVSSADSLAADVARALRTSVAEPAGPTWIGLPQDVLESTVPVEAAAEARRAVDVPRNRPDRNAVADAARLLGGATRPVLVAGGDVARHGAVDALVTLAERLGATVLGEDRRGFQRTAFPTAHHRFAGWYAATHPAVVGADLVFFVGCRVFTEFEAPAGDEFPRHATVVHAHVDPTEVGRLYPVHRGLVGHLGAVLDDLLAVLPPGPPTGPRGEPVRGGAAPPSAGNPAGQSAANPAGRPGFPGHVGLGPVVAALVDGLGTDATVVLDATTATPALLSALPQHRSDQVLLSSSGSLGWGTGAALGVRLARPGQPVVAVLGDGSFQFGIQALWTAAHYRIPVTFVVLNNGSYSAVGSALHRFGGAARRTGRWPGTDISGPRIAEIAAGFGVPATRVTGPADLAAALRAVRDTAGPALVEVLTGPGRQADPDFSPRDGDGADAPSGRYLDPDFPRRDGGDAGAPS
ncbi:benzoylformate decarboxylase [Plantactinospora mayteni]|uniref:Benzoylformate decarboxylase n=1 Tax=Plantactinospora mayteni TaxID=566021 RepID=A0ABQ4F3U2_9ACTN|nr:thiamine pyrophosphate-binding protein [Plantactinospora mayteni]GIH01563.1 benzoylformate decarboxylase [Plantactinospora mayteni]